LPDIEIAISLETRRGAGPGERPRYGGAVNRVEAIVRGVLPADEKSWSILYAGYRAFYNTAEDPAAVAIAWRWVRDREHGMRGFVVEDATGDVVALANIRLFARPSVGRLGLYLDDIFTSPASRGLGHAGAMLDHIAALAEKEGASVVRWITASDNVLARSVYDTRAAATPWVTYDMQPGVTTAL
jgi:GNAT superfamily N-acetyltransferase